MKTSVVSKNAFLVLIIVCILCLPSWGCSMNKQPPEYDPRDMRERYQNWLKQHGKKYKDRDEWLLRFGIYQSNVQFIDFINSMNLSYKLTDNKFADMTNEEFRFYNLGFGGSNRTSVKSQGATHQIDTSDLPPSVDWRTQGAVTAIKDQGNCGSCWAFSAVAAIEGLNKINKGNLVSLSEQELVDCDVTSDNQGCDGGFMAGAFDYVVKTGGLTTETDYPYTGTDGTCKKNETKNAAVSITGYKKLPANDEKSLQAAVAQQPVSVAMDAGGYAFQLYSEGIFNGYCGTDLDHGVTLIGYGEEDGNKYWLVKNSWGTSWGEAGFVKMVREFDDEKGICGIAMEPSYPIQD